MGLSKITVENGRFVVVATEETLESKPVIDKAIEAASIDKARRVVRDESRRAAFYAWAEENPGELDKILDECQRYGVLFESEYFGDADDQ